MRKLLVVLSLLIAFSGYAQEQSNRIQRANYELPARFSPKNIRRMVKSTSVRPHWLTSGNFWYSYTDKESEKWYLVNPKNRTKKPLFNNAEMARKITLMTRDPHNAAHLGIKDLKFSENEKYITFEVPSKQIDSTEIKKREEAKKKAKKDSTSHKKKKRHHKRKKPAYKTFYLKYNLRTRELTELPKDTTKNGQRWATFSPDSSKVIYAKNFNLYWMDRANFKKAKKDEKDSTIVEHAFTKGGVQYYDWGGYGSTTYSTIDMKKYKEKRRRVRLLWSPDGKHFILTRKDNRDIHNLWVIHSVGSKRPKLETYKYMMPGEKDSTETELYIFDMPSMTHKKVDIWAFKNQMLSLWSKRTPKAENTEQRLRGYRGPGHAVTWLGTNNFFYMSRTSRDEKRLDLLKVSVDGQVTVLTKERSNVYLSDVYGTDIQKPYMINDGKELVWWSQRDGWGQLYLLSADGKVEDQITKGEYHVSDVVGVDKNARKVYFVANGREEGENPYLRHLYSASLDGGQVMLLNKGNYDHQISMNDGITFFVDNYSRVNTTPKSALYNRSGKEIMNLEKADLSQLFAAGYKFPEPFKVKAADGITDLYGVMYKPFNFDSTKVYPLIEYVYPGPQTEAVNRSFSTYMTHTDRLAQFGFIVITVGNRGGSPLRSEWYHTYGYGNLRDYGLADKKVAAEQIIQRYSFVDHEKIGINGHSGGGFMTAAAMFVYPDFFKVGVSESGNHDNSIYNRRWSERHNGVKEKISRKGDTTFAYSIDKNNSIAKNLKGHLLLVTGDIDNNVHPANTIRVVNALIKANKRFDFLLLPGERHGYRRDSEYFFWRMGDYFSKYLLGDSRSNRVNIKEIDEDIPQTR